MDRISKKTMNHQPIRVELLALVPMGSTLVVSISYQHDLANGAKCERDTCRPHQCALCGVSMGPLLDERSRSLAMEGCRP